MDLSTPLAATAVAAGLRTDGARLWQSLMDLALLVGPDQKWLSTTGFLDKIDENLKTAMTA